MVDTHETISCPACGKTMKKVFIPNLGINIDICTEGCGGIFFDNREFKQFDEQNESIDMITKELENKEFIPVDENQVRICPACGAKMVKNSTRAEGDVIVDDCYSCGGKFLDQGELEKIRKEFRTEKDRAGDAVRYLYSKVGKEIAAASNPYASERVAGNMQWKKHSPIYNLFTKIMGL